MNRKKLVLIPVLLAVVAVAVLGYIHYQNGKAAANGKILVSGNIEITDAEISFKIPGRVSERLVNEGDPVKAGQTIARLEDRDLKAQADAAKADQQAAQASLAAMLAGSRPEEIAASDAATARAKATLDDLLAGARPQEIASAQASVTLAEAELSQARSEFARQQKLIKEGATTAREAEVAEAAARVAEARLLAAQEALKLVKEGPRQEQIKAARDALAQAEAQRDLVRHGPRKEDIDQVRARAAAADQAVILAETRLSYAAVTSPLAGVVLSKNIEPGEFVSAGTPVVTVGDLVNVWLRAYVSETDLRVKVGQKAVVTTDSWPGRTFEGRVSFISPESEFTPKSVQTPKERVRLVYRIKIDIVNPDMALKAGMPADAEIIAGE
jgi:HlyD family secretion protein